MIGVPERRPIDAAPRRAWTLASHLQRDLATWVRDQPPAAVTHARALRLRGPVDDGRLLDAIAGVVRESDVLNHELREVDGELRMVGRAEPHEVMWTEAGGAAPTGEERCLAVLLAERDRPVDPARDQLARFHVVRLGPDDLVLGLVAHELVLDLRSLYVTLETVLERVRGGGTGARPSFAAHATADPLPGLLGQRWRRDWWAQRLDEWAGEPRTRPEARRTATAVLLVDDERWRRLANLTPVGGNTSTLTVIALLAWCLRVHDLRDRTATFGSVIDLRDLLRLPPLVGPLSDRHVFAVDLTDFARLTFGDLVLRTHAGLLDAVGCYVPYGSLLAHAGALGRVEPPRVAALWDFFVHYCRNPPREAGGGAGRVAVELFGDTRLVGLAGVETGPTWDGGNFDAYVVGADGQVAIVVNFNELLVDPEQAREMLTAVDVVIDRVVAEPGIPLRRL